MGTWMDGWVRLRTLPALVSLKIQFGPVNSIIFIFYGSQNAYISVKKSNSTTNVSSSSPQRWKFLIKHSQSDPCTPSFKTLEWLPVTSTIKWDFSARLIKSYLNRPWTVFLRASSKMFPPAHYFQLPGPGTILDHFSLGPGHLLFPPQRVFFHRS